MPWLNFAEITVQALSPGLTRIVVGIHNQRPMATRAAVEIDKRSSRPDVLSVAGPGLRVLSSGRVTDRFNVRVEAARFRPARLEIERIPGMTIERFAFLVTGKGEARIVFDSAKGGLLQRTIRVGR